MCYTIENLNNELAQAMATLAESNHRSFDEEVLEALKSRAQLLLRRKSMQRFRAMREELLKNRGVPFSDSTDIIRESRQYRFYS